MRKSLFLYSTLTALFIFLFAFNTVQAQQATDAHTIKPAKFARLMKQNNTVIIDVRTPEEFKESHIAGAVNMDVKSDAFVTNINGLDRSKTYLLYCKSARRSATALNLMQTAGFKKVKHLKGGIENWKGKKE